MPRDHRVVAPAAALSLGASVCFLIVTLGNTFAAATGDTEALAVTRQLGTHVIDQRVIIQRIAPLSRLFLGGVLLLLLSFGAAGWARSRRLGYVTTSIAVAGVVGIVWVLQPFMR